MTDIIDRIVRLEAGELPAADTIDLFSDLLHSGLAWSLQGSYGRMAASLIESGVLNEDGSFGPNYGEHV
jgi:hypothetical protein